MTGGDRTGPMGMGPMTGRAAGYCAGYNVPGYMNPIPGRGGFGYGRGFGRGHGRGRGFGRGFGWRWAVSPYYGYGAPYVNPYAASPAISAQDEAKALKEEAHALQEEIAAINQRVKELESESKESDE